MKVFLDFEASSLSDRSYPVEVAWVFQDGRSESHLIRPAAEWTDWDDEAEAIHGITRGKLASDGEPHDDVAARMVEALGGHDIFASAPSWDGKWLSVLLRGAGLPRHELRLRDTDEALRATAAEILQGVLPNEALPGVRLSGKLTMSENIADLGGIVLAVDAYHSSLMGKPAPVVAGLTGDQRVFLGWAQLWREKIRDEALREQVATDEHAPGAWRVTMPIRNVQAWYDAYDVSPSDKLYLAPTKRAAIW